MFEWNLQSPFPLYYSKIQSFYIVAARRRLMKIFALDLKKHLILANKTHIKKDAHQHQKDYSFLMRKAGV